MSCQIYSPLFPGWQPCPNLSDYVSFVRNVVGIPDTLLPNPVVPQIVTDNTTDIVTDWQDSAITSTGGVNWFILTLGLALETVNHQLRVSPATYTWAVYNLGADRLINFAQDVPKQSFFKKLREDLKIYSPALGVPTAASDQGTSVGLLNPDQLRGLTLADLQTLKTPQGRVYLGIAQSVGSVWGLS
jgi:hypothetical protein